MALGGVGDASDVAASRISGDGATSVSSRLMVGSYLSSDHRCSVCS